MKIQARLHLTRSPACTWNLVPAGARCLSVPKRPSKLTAMVILFCFALQLFGCATTKLVKPDQKPRRLKSKKIEVITSESTYLFSEIRVNADTLFGVYGVPFPADRHSPEVTSVPYASIQSIRYRGPDWRKTSAIFFGVAALAGFVYVMAHIKVDIHY